MVYGQPTPLRELAPALPENVLDAVDRALQKDPAARPQDIGAFILELTGRPLHSFHTGQPRNVDSAVGSLDHHTPHPTGPTTSWPKTRASSREPVRSGAVTVPSPDARGRARDGSGLSWAWWRWSGWRWEARESSGPRRETPRRRRGPRASARSSH